MFTSLPLEVQDLFFSPYEKKLSDIASSNQYSNNRESVGLAATSLPSLIKCVTKILSDYNNFRKLLQLF
jgi:hypothetical protein